MLRKENFIRAVLVVFWLLILSRIPAFINGTMGVVTIVSTLVELSFLIWGIVILRSQRSSHPDLDQKVQQNRSLSSSATKRTPGP